MLLKPEGKRKKGRPRMRWMDGWMDGWMVWRRMRHLGVVNWKIKAQAGDGWRKFLRVGQDPQRVVVPIIIIITVIINTYIHYKWITKRCKY
jgi:hypothetical protein